MSQQGAEDENPLEEANQAPNKLIIAAHEMPNEDPNIVETTAPKEPNENLKTVNIAPAEVPKYVQSKAIIAVPSESHRQQDMDTANPNQDQEIHIAKPSSDHNTENNAAPEVPSDDQATSPALKTQNMDKNENQNMENNSEVGESKQDTTENHNMVNMTEVADPKQDETDSQNKELGPVHIDQGMVKSVVSKSPSLRIAVHGMSELINTRLSTEALEICLELIEAGVQPRALAEVVLHILDLKVKKYEKENGPMLP